MSFRRRRLAYRGMDQASQREGPLTANHWLKTIEISTELTFRSPTIADAANIWRLVRDCNVLENNSSYAYLLACRHFADTCVVACDNGGIFGFIVAYRPPNQREIIFVWQIGVTAAARGCGMGRRMLQHLVDSPACRGVRFVEATVAPSNVASRKLFARFANDLSVPLQFKPGFCADDFGAPAHEDETLLRIGPL